MLHYFLNESFLFLFLLSNMPFGIKFFGKISQHLLDCWVASILLNLIGSPTDKKKLILKICKCVHSKVSFKMAFKRIKL